MADLFSGASAQISPFNFGAHAIRVIVRNGEPWFVAKDVCDALGYINSRDAVADHLDDDERSTVANSDSRNGGGKLTIINESGLYALVLRSRKPEARKFAKWVTGEVLPSIRKTGSYSATALPAQPEPKPPTLVGRRWIISIDDDGRELVRPMAWDECTMRWANLAHVIEDPDNRTDSALLAEIASACARALAKRTGHASACKDLLKQHAIQARAEAMQ